MKRGRYILAKGILMVIVGFSSVLYASIRLVDSTYPIKVISVESSPVVIKSAQVMKDVDSGKVAVYVSAMEKARSKILKSTTILIAEVDSSSKNILQASFMQVPLRGKAEIVEEFEVANNGKSEFVVMPVGYGTEDNNEFRLDIENIKSLIYGSYKP